MTSSGDIESNQAANADECITDMKKFNVNTKTHHPKHIFDYQSEWIADPALRIGQLNHQSQ